MPRDEERYFYLHDVGIEKGSWVLQQFLDDARDHNMLDLLPKFLVSRLADYYKLQERMTTQSLQPPQETPALKTQDTSVATMPSGSRRRRNTASTTTSPVENQVTDQEAADFWANFQ